MHKKLLHPISDPGSLFFIATLKRFVRSFICSSVRSSIGPSTGRFVTLSEPDLDIRVSVCPALFPYFIMFVAMFVVMFVIVVVASSLLCIVSSPRSHHCCRHHRHRCCLRHHRSRRRRRVQIVQEQCSLSLKLGSSNGSSGGKRRARKPSVARLIRLFDGKFNM